MRSENNSVVFLYILTWDVVCPGMPNTFWAVSGADLVFVMIRPFGKNRNWLTCASWMSTEVSAERRVFVLNKMFDFVYIFIATVKISLQ